MIVVSFTPADALALLALLSSGGIVTLIAQSLKRATMSDGAKFGIALLLSVLLGGLTAYGAGEFGYQMSLVEAAGIVFTSATGVYQAVFKRYGWDKSVFPDPEPDEVV
jgi:hypothetical protein